MNFNEMIEAHEKAGAAISIATLPVNAKDATSFGILKTNDENVITSFIEKPKADLLPEWTSEVSEEMNAQGRNYLASMGIYVFNKDLLVELMKDQSTTDFGKEIIPNAIQNNKVLSYQYEGYWTDIGNIDSFFEANLELTNDIPQFNLFDNERKIFTNARVLPPTKMTGETHIHQSLIAEGGIIVNSSIRNSVIGIRSRIGAGTIIEKSFIMGCDFYQDISVIKAEIQRGEVAMGIGENCYIFQTILDKNCRIGNNVRLNGGVHLPDSNDQLVTVKDGIIVVKKGATLPDGYTLG
jgi:glucose-1-phosphate adenylyltransferase